MIYILRVSNHFVVFSEIGTIFSRKLLFTSLICLALLFINLSKLKLIKTIRSLGSRITNLELFIRNQL